MSVTVLFFTEGGDVAEVYREHLPAGWRLETLTSRHDEEEQLERVARADILIHTDVPLTRRHLEAADRLKLIHRQGVGVDAVDFDAVESRGIPVCICPVGTPEAVAEHTIMLMLAVNRHLVALHEEVRDGRWPKWAYRMRSLDLAGATVGLVGFGRIGQAVARRLLAFDSRLLVHLRPGRMLGPEWPAPQVRPSADLEELFATSDVVSLHCPLTPETRGLVDRDLLALMPPHARLVNTSRGGLVVEQDLVAALAEGRPAAAGLDVLAQEPPPADHPLRRLPNVVLTPHTAAGTATAQHAKARAVLENAQRVLDGAEPRYRVH